MEKIKIDEMKCPYCNSNKIEGVDTISSETTEEEGYDLSSYYCYECEEHFYIESFLEVYCRNVRKTKWAK